MKLRLRTPLWLRLLPDRPLFALATLWGLGRLRPGPGTWGTFAGLVWFTVAYIPSGPWWAVAPAALLILLAVWVCNEAEFRSGRTDPPEVVLDEFVAVPLCFLGLHHAYSGPGAWIIFVGAFILFRILDIVKPLGIRSLQRLPGGLGVVADDLAAALVTCGCLHVLVWQAPHWFEHAAR